MQRSELRLSVMRGAGTRLDEIQNVYSEIGFLW